MNHLLLVIKQFEPLKHFSANICVGRRATSSGRLSRRQFRRRATGKALVKPQAVHLPGVVRFTIGNEALFSVGSEARFTIGSGALFTMGSEILSLAAHDSIPYHLRIEFLRLLE